MFLQVSVCPRGRVYPSMQWTMKVYIPPQTQKQTLPGHRGRHTPDPEGRHPHPGRHLPLGRHPPYGEERAVLILLEYILVFIIFIHSQLIGWANTWLQSNPEYRIVNCETVVQYWARSHGYNPYRAIATRSEVQADVTVCMHVLRYVVMVIQSLSLFFLIFGGHESILWPPIPLFKPGSPPTHTH